MASGESTTLPVRVSGATAVDKASDNVRKLDDLPQKRKLCRILVEP